MGHVLYWDFFGPHGQKTAEHFVSHTREFLARHAITPLRLDVEAGERCFSVACQVPESDEPSVAQALRPRRATIIGESSELARTDV